MAQAAGDAEPQWWFLDRDGKEFGPYSSSRMRSWFREGQFPVGDRLLVRLEGWQRHCTVRDVFPDGETFRGRPLEPGEGSRRRRRDDGLGSGRPAELESHFAPDPAAPMPLRVHYPP